MRDQCSCGHPQSQHFGHTGLCVIGDCTCLGFVSLVDTQKIIITRGDAEFLKITVPDDRTCTDRRCQHSYLRHDPELLGCMEEECGCCIFRE